ncbi:MAG: hypothetical protein E7421_06965 [Ruminococcaceae bacterium]|nr:hypothetical protein [Oscillospiraceae bacterium]
MNHSSKHSLFPWVSLFAGIVGFAMRSLLLSLASPEGLLPKNHIFDILSYLLLAVVFAVCILEVRKMPPRSSYTSLFPASAVSAVGILVSAIGIGFSGFTLKATGVLQLLLPVLGVLSAAALVVVAYCRYKGLRPNCLLHGIVVVYLILRIMACCRAWGTEPQLQLYFFHLLACLFLLLACYYRAELDVQNKDCRRYIFFSQLALFCSFLCLPGADWLFYLSAILLMGTDSCAISSAGQTD